MFGVFFPFLSPHPFFANLDKHRLIFQCICKQIAASDFMVGANGVRLELRSSTSGEQGDQTENYVGTL